MEPKPKFYMTIRHARMRLNAIETVLADCLCKINELYDAWERWEEQ
jgi:hypothetical protein